MFNQKEKKPSVIKTCIECGKEFKVYPYRSITAKVCSYACRDKNKTKNSTKTRQCKNCGKEFITANSQFKYYSNAGKYCSRVCLYEGCKNETRKKPIRDKYGRSKRYDDLKWQKAVREKDKSICQRCGVYQKYTHTHHVVLRSQSKKLKHEVSNGICLCNSCHSWVHGNPKEARQLGFIKSAPNI